MAQKQQDGRKVVCSNRRARHDYEIIDTLEAGIVLTGSEVKSMRQGSVQLVDSYAEVVGGEAWLVGANIAQYACASYMNHEPRRRRKLLLHAKELHKLEQRVREKGLTIVPLEVYFKEGFAKVLIATARGRKEYDKRDKILKKDQARARHD